MKNEFKKNCGFTLVEMLIAVSLFVVIVTFSLGAIITIFDANKKAQSSKTVVDNLNLSLENMSRTVRFGSNYHCGLSGPSSSSGGSLSSPNNCSAGDTALAVTFKGSVKIFRLNGTAIQISNDSGGTYTNITSSETVIQYLKFYVFGSDSSDAEQPYVVAVIKGYVGKNPTTQTTFFIETTMSQRTLDI